MMRPYAVFLHEGILRQMPRRKEPIMRFVRELANDPFRRGDYEDRDAVGRELQVKFVGGHAITYWADHAARGVKIVIIQPADRNQT